MGRILSSVEVDGSIPIEFNRSQNFTSRIEILCCLTAREATWVSDYQYDGKKCTVVENNSFMAKAWSANQNLWALAVPKYWRSWASGRCESCVPARNRTPSVWWFPCSHNYSAWLGMFCVVFTTPKARNHPKLPAKALYCLAVALHISQSVCKCCLMVLNGKATLCKVFKYQYQIEIKSIHQK